MEVEVALVNNGNKFKYFIYTKNGKTREYYVFFIGKYDRTKKNIMLDLYT